MAPPQVSVAGPAAAEFAPPLCPFGGRGGGGERLVACGVMFFLGNVRSCWLGEPEPRETGRSCRGGLAVGFVRTANLLGYVASKLMLAPIIFFIHGQFYQDAAASRGGGLFVILLDLVG